MNSGRHRHAARHWPVCWSGAGGEAGAEGLPGGGHGSSGSRVHLGIGAGPPARDHLYVPQALKQGEVSEGCRGGEPCCTAGECNVPPGATAGSSCGRERAAAWTPDPPGAGEACADGPGAPAELKPGPVLQQDPSRHPCTPLIVSSLFPNVHFISRFPKNTSGERTF